MHEVFMPEVCSHGVCFHMSMRGYVFTWVCTHVGVHMYAEFTGRHTHVGMHV